MQPMSTTDNRGEVMEVVAAADMPDFKPSKLRFVVALLQCLSCGLNGFILQTYVAIWWIVSDTYAVESTKINWMSMVYAVMFIPGSMLSIYLYAKFGLSYCLIGGALLNFASTWIRAIGGFSYNAPDVPDIYGMYDGMYAAANTSAMAYPVTDSVKASNSFSVQLFGQILGALGQPLLLNAPPRYATTAQQHPTLNFNSQNNLTRISISPLFVYVYFPPSFFNYYFNSCLFSLPLSIPISHLYAESPTIGSPRASETSSCTS